MHSALEALRRLGPVNAGLMLAARAASVLSAGRARLVKYYFMAQPVPREPGRAARSGGIVVEELAQADPRLPLLERPAEEIARRFARSSRCFAAWHDGALAGFLWITERSYDEAEVRCTFRLHPADAAVWDFDVHVVPRFRLGRTFALLWEAAFGAMRDRGIRWSISRVDAFNPESLRAHQRIGARCTGWAVFLLLGSFQLTLTRHGRLKCRRLEQRPYPELEVRAPAERVSDEASAFGHSALVAPAGPPRGPGGERRG